ncbi:hypothetical protein J4Q44_G00249070 [Coregonus suidteri]|uniref:S100P-binding protein n=1 Tax=Coregonus suidteri TaxID=861788 RepID=A0AAN8LMY8_9TELE
MDALKSAGRAIIRSPSLAKQSWGVGRHKKLPENWTDTRETLLEGMVFQLKYLGVTLVEQPKGEELSAAAVKRIVATAKASGKKLQKVTLKVSPRGIILYDYASNQLIENISIYRISYCTADKMHDKVFAYIAQSQQNETLECHAYLCTKRKVAQAVTLTVAQAFRVAFEFWQAAKEDKEKRVKSGSDGEGASSSQSESLASLGSLKGGEVATGNLLDLAEGANMALVHLGTKESEPDPFMVCNHSTENNNTVWELEDGLDEAFSRLAESRTNPQVLDIGVNPQDFNTEECLSPTNWDKMDADNAEKDDIAVADLTKIQVEEFLILSVQAGEAGSRQGGAAAPGGPVSNESEAWSETLSHEPKSVSMDLGPVFDFDVDDIMCLSPIDSDRGSDEGIEAFVEDRARNPSDSDTQQTKPFLAYSPTQEQVSGEGDEVGEREEGRGEEMVVEGEREKEGNEEINCQEEEDGVSDEGYFSRSYLEALRAGKDVSQAVTPLQPHISSTPLFRGREVMQRLQMAVSDEGEPQCPPGFPDPNGGQAVVCQPHYSFTSEDVSYGLYGAPLVPVEGADEALEGTVGDDWSIGAPILKCSVCHIAPVEFNAGCEGNVVEGGGGGLVSVQECQVTLVAEEVTVETSYKNTLPLQVQVRSVVVVPSVQQNSSSKPSTWPEQKGSETRSVQKPSPEKNVVKTTTRPVQKPSPGQNIIKNTIVQKPLPGQNVIKNTTVLKPPEQNAIKATPVQKPSPQQKVTKIKPVHAASTSSDQKVVKTRPVQKTAPRPVVYDREEDWQREKWLYVESVTRHIRENIGAEEGVMTELLKLMNHVADQVPGTNGRQWQHPSDLTRRNYQRRFGNDSVKYTLDQWQNQNYRNHRRFAKVPQIFERSQVL